MTEQKEKVCKNCRYYLAHYIIRGVRYLAAGGQCMNEDLMKMHIPKREREGYRFKGNCALWEPIAIQKAERRENIKETLKAMQKSLSEIAMILQNDEE